MSLRFILGRAGTGKTSSCLEEMSKEIEAKPDGKPLIYLVPEQMSFQSEYNLSTARSLQGNIRAQVLSFSRLAYRILGETGGMTRTHLDNRGMNMLLCRIVERQKDKLKVFDKVWEKPGFSQQLEEMVAELKRYCITPELLQDSRERLQGEQALDHKLQDLAVIYAELEQEMAQHYLYNEDYLPLLATKIDNSSYLKGARVWVDGFHYLDPQELLVLKQLIIHCDQVNITLTLDRPYDHQLPGEMELFYQPAQTYQKIKELAEESLVDIEGVLDLNLCPETKVKGTPLRFKERQALGHLEEYFNVRPPVPATSEEGVTLAAAVNRRVEIEQVAREIIALVRDGDYRYKDVAIIVRDLEPYHDLIRTVFSYYHIPFFIDQKRPMFHHPLIELIRSSLEVVTHNWTYDAVFRCIKTELLYPVESIDELGSIRSELDVFENYVLEFGIKGSKWQQEWQRGKKKYDLVRINQLRELVSTQLLQFQKKLKKAETGRDMCTALYYLLEELDIPEKLKQIQQKAEAEGDLLRAREHSQVWKAVLELLDQLVEIMGAEEMSPQQFVRFIEAGIDSMCFALVPPAIDQVMVASMDRSRLSNVSCAFILGVNDGIVPARVKEKGILSEEERDLMAIQGGILLGPDTRRKLLDEQFIIYNALTSASDKLWLSYPLADEEGKALLPSNLLNLIKKLFPQLKEQMIYPEPGEEMGGDDLNYVTLPRQTLSHLVASLRQWRRGYPVDELWWEVYNWYVKDSELKQQAAIMLGSLFYTNQEQKLNRRTGEVLFGNKLQVSVSRIEKYKQCPFAHFAHHGLKLRERKIFRLETPDLGQLFHQALTLFTQRVISEKRDWATISQEESMELAAQAVDELAPQIQSEILMSSNRYMYLTKKLKAVVGKSAAAMCKHVSKSKFAPRGLELEFGPKGQLPPLELKLDDNSTIELVGSIDRVDVAKEQSELYLRIVDYKSSGTDLDLSQVYHGLSLQMLTYLDVALTHSEEWLGTQALPAGLLYFHVHNPMYSTAKELKREELEQELFKAFKMKGLVVADSQIAKMMDVDLEQGSDIVPVRLKKDGQFDSRASVIGEEEIGVLRKHTRDVFIQSGREILAGNIEINPYKLKDKKACTYCSFKPFCAFDESIEGNDYRQLQVENKQKIVQKLKQKEALNGEVD
ncbi:ATP-dependent helicase/nuclease subunit B [Desulfitispora alkaliphila]|uniref:helicase-exonuclease AddAB subunit AddB n=1 Tax=Desulfitispora alkaliphila TaxID=622674 RepID=UPI003D24BA16